ncbi:uncharacterized protein A4U43_C10F340 [Asparagus officinalis]|uniref:AB hydrolase-1 domain-containing protein n=1 Tax=Asparagus officinalis TaxID=4686 RepID=A0A5P1E192_ASPOF|nr:uncharacterized protein A4U43_C10F340 [Asparagus officinalis]
MGFRSSLAFVGRLVNELVSFVVFSALDLLDVFLCLVYKLADYAKEAALDLLDVFLCLVYKLADYAKEAEWKPCYCSSSSTNDMIASSGNILVSDGNNGRSKIVCLCSSSKLQLEDISDTLYCRSSIVSDISRATVEELRRKKVKRSATTTVTINSTIVQMLKGKIGGQQSHPVPRWSDCDCKTCTSWSSASRNSLYVHVQSPDDGSIPKEDVLFIHGFISSSAFWTETVFPNFSESARSKYRLLAVDLLGFSLYTLREHVDMIERVIEQHDVKSFHIVAHSLGSILALALAVKYPDSIKSLTLLAPPYFPVPKGEQGTQYVLRKVAPRRVWPLMAFGASLACWYEHISRTICLLICKNHRVWEFLFKFITRNRIKTFLMEGFFCHTHNAAWHTLHNIICGSADKIDGYLDTVRDRLDCNVTVIHGRKDEVLPVECSIAVKSRIPRANLKIIDNKDHITVIVGNQKSFARELEEIWNNTKQ